MIRILVIIISSILFSTSIANSKYGTQISQKDYLSIFIKYGIKNRDIVQNIINKCINELGKKNIKITTDNKGEKIINHYNKEGFLNCTYENILQKIKPIAAINSLKSKNLEEFILNNELTFNDGKGNGKVTYIFNKEGYEIFKDGKKIGNDGWRFSKTKPSLRRHAPRFGEANTYVFGTLLGLTNEEIDELFKAGVSSRQPDVPRPLSLGKGPLIN